MIFQRFKVFRSLRLIFPLAPPSRFSKFPPSFLPPPSSQVRIVNETQEPGSSKMGTFWSNWSLFDLEIRFVLAGLVENMVYFAQVFFRL